MKRVSVVAAIAALSGCAMAQQTHLADGSKGYSIDCSGQALNWGYCERKAGDLCGEQGYQVLSKDGEQSGPMVSANQYGLYANSMVNRSMMVRCGD